MAVKAKIMDRCKRTEIGTIPKHWDVVKIPEILRRNGIKIGPFGSQLKKDFLTDSGYKVYGQENVYVKNMEIGNRYISKERFFSLKSCEILVGDFLISMMGTVGKCMIVKELNEQGIMDSHLIRLRTDKDKVYNEFLLHIFTSKLVIHQIKKLSVGGIMEGLSSKIIKNISIPQPPLHEQKAIATALTDTDNLIQSLEKLIEKKKKIKQGAMQQLLTGKKRLPGFSGEWEVRKLNTITWFQEGPGVRTHQFTESGMKLLNGTNIQDGKLTLDRTNRYITLQQANGIYSHFLANEGDVIIASSGVTIDKFHEKVTEVKKCHLPFCMNTSTIRFKVKQIVSKYYIMYFLKSNEFKVQIGGQATGSAQLNFGPSHLNKINVIIPPTIEEQKAVAKVLSDMDSEIELLEQKLEKYKTIKQGMMQELLTGRIRLI